MGSSVFLWINAGIYFILGSILMVYVLRNWHDPKKQATKIAELIQSCLLFVIGGYLIFFFNSTPFSLMNLIMFIWFCAIYFWLLVPNILYTYLRVRHHPELIERRNYTHFLNKMKEIYTNQEISQIWDKRKDYGRKFLHFLQFLLIVLIHILVFRFTPEIERWGISSLQFRNFLYFCLGSFFIFMLFLADIMRFHHFEYIPDWAQNWFTKSLEPREIWTLNAALTILLANLLFLHPLIPTPIFFGTMYISCVSDAIASLIGKNFGKHKMTKMGCFPQKSFEGWWAGGISAFFGVFVIFILSPLPGFEVWMYIVIGLVAGMCFMGIDGYCNFVTDNLLNPLIIGPVISLVVLLFSLIV